MQLFCIVIIARRIQQIFDDEKEALGYAKKWSRPEKGDYYVTPNKKGEQEVFIGSDM